MGLGAALAILALSVGVLMAGAADSTRQTSSLPIAPASVDTKPIPFSAMAVHSAAPNLGIDKH